MLGNGTISQRWRTFREDGVRLKEYNPFRINEEYEILHPGGTFEPVTILSITGDDGESLSEVRQPKQTV